MLRCEIVHVQRDHQVIVLYGPRDEAVRTESELQSDGPSWRLPGGLMPCGGLRTRLQAVMTEID